MKKILILGILWLTIVNCKSQNVQPLENAKHYIINDLGFPNDVIFKDINGTLNKFVGTWKGVDTKNNKYTFLISKVSKPTDFGIEDYLYMRYQIQNYNDQTIENTLDLSDRDHLVITGDYLDGNFYRFIYTGREAICGQIGTIAIWSTNKPNHTEIKLNLMPDHVLIDSKCIGKDKQIIPTIPIVLTKQ